MRSTPPPIFGEDPKTEEAFAAHSDVMPPARAAQAEHVQGALGTAEQRVWTTLPNVAVTPAENRALTKFCTEVSVDVGPPAVDSSEVLRAFVRAMRNSEELRHWVRDELVRLRSSSKPGLGLGDGAGPASTELKSVDGGSASARAHVVVLSRRGRHRAPPHH